MVSDEEIIKLWRDPKFDGSYRGVRTFQILLKTELNYDVSLDRLYKLLTKDQIYLIHQRKKHRFPRRHYYVHNYGELCQMDIAHMFQDEETKFKYFLLFVDVFSSKIFAEPLKTREAPEVLTALKKITNDFGSQIYELQSDRETAFGSKVVKDLFRNKNIVYR